MGVLPFQFLMKKGQHSIFFLYFVANLEQISKIRIFSPCTNMVTMMLTMCHDGHHDGYHDGQYFEDVQSDQNTQAFTFGRMLAE